MREGVDQRLMRFVLEMRQAGVTDPKVLSAMELTPRAAFAPEHMAALALDDVNLPLPCGQVMTKPSVVGRMVSALNLSGGERVLEIGCGSGYQTAVIAGIADKVTGLDRHARLVTDARAALGKLRFDRAHTHLADGRDGWPAAGPFDRIILNVAVAALPDALLAQAAPGAIIVAPMMTDRGVRLFYRSAGEAGSGLDFGPIDLAPLDERPLTPQEDCSGP